MSTISDSKAQRMTNFRWVLCALLFVATTVNYLDRQVLSLTWKDFISAMQNGEELLPYAERLYQRAVETVPCADRDGALVYTQCLLYHYMEEYNRQLLVKAVNHFMIS